MKALSETLALFVPPLWLTALVAAVSAAALLMAFVSTLQENVRRGESLRDSQRIGTVRHGVGMVAAAAPGAEARQSVQPVSDSRHP